MIDKERLVKKIEKLPPHLLEEVANYVDFVKFKELKDAPATRNITLASEKSLSKDWLKPEEDETWKDL